MRIKIKKFCRDIEIKRFERGKGYETILIFAEIYNAKHIGYFLIKENTMMTKGGIAKHIRDLKIPKVEMVAPPPPSTNALLMIRLSDGYDKSLLIELGEKIFEYLSSKGLLD